MTDCSLSCKMMFSGLMYILARSIQQFAVNASFKITILEDSIQSSVHTLLVIMAATISKAIEKLKKCHQLFHRIYSPWKKMCNSSQYRIYYILLLGSLNSYYSRQFNNSTVCNMQIAISILLKCTLVRKTSFHALKVRTIHHMERSFSAHQNEAWESFSTTK